MRFVTGLFLPTVAAGIVTCVALALFFHRSADTIDAELVLQQELQGQNALADYIEITPGLQAEFAVWDDAVLAHSAGDVGWLVENLGLSVFGYHRVARIMVFDANGKPLMAMRDGGEVPTASVQPHLSELQPVFDALRSLDMVAAISAYKNGVIDEVPHVEAVLLFEGLPSLVTASPLFSETGDVDSPAGSEAIYVWVNHFDQTLADRIGDQQFLSDARFVTEMPEDAHPSVPVATADGTPIAFLTWTPERPGARLLWQSVPGLAIGLAVAAGIVGLLLHRLRIALTQLQAEREEAHYRALHDPLTGLGNRSLFQTRLSDSIRSMPRGEPRLALLAIDLDHFKPVNDSLGHAAGDDLLRQTAGRIRALLGPEDTLVRLGGDEFAVIQGAIETHDQPMGLARAIIAAVSQPFLVANNTVQIGVSIGIATAPDLAADETDLTRHADLALYRAKNGGRNRFCLYSPEQPSEAQRLQAEIEDAFERRAGTAA
jgi:diguanylate cyclase (GGDEF)-like protein